MNFDFDDQQYALRDSVRAMLADCWSIARQREAAGRDGPWADLLALGLHGALVPEAEGGLALGILDVVMVLEELGRQVVPGPLVPTMLCGEAIARFGSAAQRAALLPGVAAGRTKLAFAHVDPGGTAPPDGTTLQLSDGRLSGRKILVAGGMEADALLVSVIGPSGDPAIAVIERGRDGVTTGRHIEMEVAGQLGYVELDGVVVTAADLLPSGALPLLFDLFTLAAAAEMTGLSGRAAEMAVDYAKQREQFGRPIGSFQAMKHKCADMLVAVETSRSALYYAAWALQQDDPRRDLALSMAKAFCGEACGMVCKQSTQVHGGIGFTWDFDLHILLKRGTTLEHLYGDAAWHLDRVATHAIREAVQG